MRRLFLLLMLGVAVYAAWKRFVEVAGETVDPLDGLDDIPLGDGDLPQGWVVHEPSPTA